MLDLKNNYFYFCIRDIEKNQELIEKIMLRHNYTEHWFSINTEVFKINNKTKTISGNGSSTYCNYILIENPAVLDNILDVLNKVNTFEYLKETYPREERYIHNSLTTVNMLARFLINSKELIIIKDLKTLNEYIVTENRVIDCNKYLTTLSN
jgi:hypothetical protein